MRKIAFVLCLVLAACSGSNPKLQPKVDDQVEKVSEISDINKEAFRPSLDIIFVVDDSGSMSSHQQNLAANIDKFADAIVKTKFLDYHVGVISSSMSSFIFGGGCCGKLIGVNGNPIYVERSTPDGIAVLAENLNIGTSGDSSEQFFSPLKAALSAPLINNHNKGFYRQDAYLAVFFITDTDDQSGLSAQAMYDFLVKLKGSKEKLLVSGAYIPDVEVDTCSGESYEINNNDKLPDFFKLTNAAPFSLCSDFGDQLVEFGKLLASKTMTMYLSKIPKKGTISIKIGTDELPNDALKGWTYNPVKNAIEFGPEIEWEKYPDNAFPQIDFEANDLGLDPDKKK